MTKKTQYIWCTNISMSHWHFNLPPLPSVVSSQSELSVVKEKGPKTSNTSRFLSRKATGPGTGSAPPLDSSDPCRTRRCLECRTNPSLYRSESQLLLDLVRSCLIPDSRFRSRGGQKHVGYPILLKSFKICRQRGIGTKVEDTKVNERQLVPGFYPLMICRPV